MTQPRLRQSLFAVALLLASTLVACGGDDPTAPGGVGTGPVSAVIDGVPFTATLAFATNTGGIVAVGASGLSGEGVGFAFQGGTTGTYTFGAAAVHNANYNLGADSWIAGAGQGSGSIVVTTLNATRVAGTFAFEAVTFTGGTPATRSITGGVFDVEF